MKQKIAKIQTRKIEEYIVSLASQGRMDAAMGRSDTAPIASSAAMAGERPATLCVECIVLGGGGHAAGNEAAV